MMRTEPRQSRRRISWAPILLTIITAAAALGCHQGQATKEDFHGRDLVVRGEYEEAIIELERYLEHEPNGRFASRAGLFLGKAHLALGQIDAADAAFRRTMRDYPASLEAHKCQYKLALLALLQNEREQARRSFESIAERPNGPLAPEAAAMAAYLALER